MAAKPADVGGLADKFWFKYLLSAAAATVAESATYPLDLTKTRLQIQGELRLHSQNQSGAITSPTYRGMFRTAYGIGVVDNMFLLLFAATEEGVARLWQGVTPAIYRHVVYTGCRIGFYEWIRENILHKNADGAFPFWKAVIGGLTAGGLAQFIASPTDLVKVQMQMEGRRRVEGKPPRVKSPLQAFRKILKEGGVRGLWKGWVPNVQRAALVNLGDLTTYDTAKHTILRHTNMTDNHLTHAMASACSGFVSAVLGTPADVIKTRIMNQPTKNGRGVLYKSSVDCLLKTVRSEGFGALYKGFVPIWARMAPWSLTFWLTYEQIRTWAGTASF